MPIDSKTTIFYRLEKDFPISSEVSFCLTETTWRHIDKATKTKRIKTEFGLSMVNGLLCNQMTSALSWKNLYEKYLEWKN